PRSPTHLRRNGPKTRVFVLYTCRHPSANRLEPAKAGRSGRGSKEDRTNGDGRLAKSDKHAIRGALSRLFPRPGVFGPRKREGRRRGVQKSHRPFRYSRERRGRCVGSLATGTGLSHCGRSVERKGRVRRVLESLEGCRSG